MFPFVTRRASRRLVRKTVSQVSKALISTAKATRSAAAKSAKTMKAAKPGRIVGARKTASPVEGGRRARGRFVDVDGLAVHYIAQGRGRPVVLLHGNGTMAEDFAICGLIERLAARYRVVAIDRPGFGRTARPRHRVWTASAQAALVHRVLEGLKVENPLVVGHSWGTLVALALATQEPRSVRGLVLLSGYFYPSRRADVTLSAPMAIPGFGDAARSLIPKAMGRALAAQAFRRVFRPQAVPARFEARFPVEIATSAAQMRAATEDAAGMNAAAAGLARRYSGLRIPVAILAGDADAVVDTEAQSGRLHRDIPGSTLTILPGIGHMTHYAARLRAERAVDRLMNPAAVTGGETLGRRTGGVNGSGG